jgi:hypothetical protein
MVARLYDAHVRMLGIGFAPDRVEAAANPLG